MTIRSSHDAAMALADQADAVLASQGDSGQAKALYAEALQWEMAAVRELLGSADADLEPTRTILLRSAASLARLADDAPQAIRLLHHALAGSPPAPLDAEIQQELDLLDAERHLALGQVLLTDEEIQVSLAQGESGPGFAKAEDVIARVGVLQRMTTRTAERRAGRPFRTAGKPDKAIVPIETYMSVARAASYVFTLRFGARQQELAELAAASPVVAAVDDVLQCLEAVERHGEDALQSLIADESYRTNFVHLARELRPDGKRVGLVGLTVLRNGQERRLALHKPAFSAGSGRQAGLDLTAGAAGAQQATLIRGRLLGAAAENSPWVNIVDSDTGIGTKVKVQEGLVEIVRQHFGDQVEATIVLGKRKAKLAVDIRKVGEE